MRIVILGDSVIFYIVSPEWLELENLKWKENFFFSEDIYGFILKRYFKSKGNNEVFVIGYVNNDTRFQTMFGALARDVKQFEPNIVIIQLGICDCAPRLFSQKEKGIILNLPKFIRKKIIKFFSKHRYFFTKRFPKVYVNIYYFRKKYQQILTEIKKIGAYPIIINIAKPSQDLLNISYNYLRNVRSYNAVLSNLAEKKKQCGLIDLYSLIEDDPNMLWKDGIHLTKYGHKKLAEILIKKIESIKIISHKIENIGIKLY